MVKRTVFLSVFIFGLSLLFPSGRVFGQERASNLGQRWVCLQSKRCNTEGSNCTVNGVGGHRARLTVKEGSNLVIGKKTYIIETVETAEGGVPTSGSSKLDAVEAPVIGQGGIFEEDNVSKLRTSIGYQFQGLFEEDSSGEKTLLSPGGDYNPNTYPLLPLAGGTLPPLEIQSKTTQPHGLKFFALQYVSSSGTEGDNQTQQQGIINFETADRDCATIYWDPEGRVFDSQSLEPIPGSKLTVKVAVGNTGKFIDYRDDKISPERPIYTSLAGEFSFYLPNGTYRLNVSAPGHTFPFDAAKINPGWTKAYSNLYYGSPSDGEGIEVADIVEAGKLVHRDIPVDPRGTPYHRAIRILSYFDTLDPTLGGGRRIFEGKVSHPLSRIKVYAKIPNPAAPRKFVRSSHLLGNVLADKNGRFKVSIDQNELKDTEMCCIVRATKVNLALPVPSATPTPPLMGRLNKIIKLVGGFFKKVNAQAGSASSIEVDPAPSYLEGYAHDRYGKIIPNAKVEVVMKNSRATYYTTKADVNGYFKIGSSSLPRTAYSLRYVSPVGVITKLKTTDFIRNNRNYIEKNKVDLYSYRDSRGNKKAIISTSPSSSSLSPTSANRGDYKNGNGKGENGSGNRRSPAKNKTAVLMVLVILLVLLGAVVGFLAVFIIKKRRSTGEEDL